MADPNTAGKDTSEWTATKWVTWICGILATILAGIVASGAIVNDAALAILSGAIPLLAAVGGVTVAGYSKGRALIKASKAQADKANPT